VHHPTEFLDLVTKQASNETKDTAKFYQRTCAFFTGKLYELINLYVYLLAGVERWYKYIIAVFFNFYHNSRILLGDVFFFTAIYIAINIYFHLSKNILALSPTQFQPHNPFTWMCLYSVCDILRSGAWMRTLYINIEYRKLCIQETPCCHYI
jgi:hypothetical protein